MRKDCNTAQLEILEHQAFILMKIIQIKSKNIDRFSRRLPQRMGDLTKALGGLFVSSDSYSTD